MATTTDTICRLKWPQDVQQIGGEVFEVIHHRVYPIQLSLVAFSPAWMALQLVTHDGLAFSPHQRRFEGCKIVHSLSVATTDIFISKPVLLE